MAAHESPEIGTSIPTSARGPLVVATTGDGVICALPELEAFVDRVLCDGRYVHTFQNNPDEAAERLGVVLSRELAHELSTTPKGTLMVRLSKAKFRAAKTGAQKDFAFPAAVDPIDITIITIVVAIVLIGIVAYIYHKQAQPGRQGKVNDNSPHKDAKL